ncbi:MAG: phage tail tape measure protein, partial [Clostridia bacterium]|nr:phage tail tape measure protein [Clostridia bacterium]
MSDYTTNASVNLTMNGEQPKKVLEELRNRAFNLENAIAKAAKAGNKTELTKLRKELKTTQRQIREMESATMQVEKVLKQLDKATPKELQRTLKTLEKQLNNLERGSEAWKRQTEYIKQVRAEIDKVNRELRNGETFWERFNRKMNDWQTTLAAGAAAVTGVVMAGRSAVNAYAEMDAEMANVRKFTGMTAEQVALLNQEFQKIDTRTSREDLNRLAQEAGRLGKTSQEDVLGFVKAADQINVALDDLGDGATLTLSKLTNIFGDEARLGTERSLLAVGSVINELSQNCTASAPYLAQFSQRLAGVGAQAGMTIPQLMAFAAVLDSQGQAVEMSATALSKLIMDLFKETDKIAQATGLDLEKFKATLESSTNEGLLMLLDRLHELGGMDVLAPVFKDMGEEGARASAVISALAGNVDTVRWQQEEANKAFQEATSVTKEFNVQNNTVQAGLDKARKRLTELAVELGEKLAPVMKHVISSTTLILKVMSSLITFIGKYKGEIIVVTASIVAYTIAVNAAAIKTKIFAVAQGVAKVAMVAWRAVTLLAATTTALFSGNITRATIAFKAFSATLKLSPIGLLVGSITAIVAGLALWITRTSKLT